MLGPQRIAAGPVHAGIGRHAVQVLVGQQTLGQRREGNHTGADLVGGVQQVLLDPAVQQVVRGLVDQHRHMPLLEQRRQLPRARGGIRRDADVQRLALLHRLRQRAGGFLQRGQRVETVRIEDVDIVQPHALQALVQTGQHVLARTTALTIGTRPHLPAGLGGDDQLVPVTLEILAQQTAEIDLRTAKGRTIVVGQVEVVDAQIKRGAQQRTLAGQRRAVAKVMPQPQRQGRQHQPAAPHAAVGHGLVAMFGGEVMHGVEGGVEVERSHYSGAGGNRLRLRRAPTLAPAVP